MRITLAVALLVVLNLCSLTARTADGEPAPPSDQALDHAVTPPDARMEWFRDAKFGMFIHWGVYSVPGSESEKWRGTGGYGEWFLDNARMPVSQYEKFAERFNPVEFDAAEWVGLAKRAGMKYIVITAKHHDGFGMYRSDLTGWCIKSTPFQRDPLKELADACEAEGIKLCFYYSIMDWHHPDWGTRRPWNDKATDTPDMDRYTEFMKGQLKELLTRYGPIGILWFDGQWEAPWTPERGKDLYDYVRSLQPDIIINNRVGKSSDVHGLNEDGAGDYGTPEQQIPANGFGAEVDWEACMTMNNTWGYWKEDENWKSSAQLVNHLVECASKGGNYLLNVGPTNEGVIPAASVERLKIIGKWMDVNGEAVYGTTASPFPKSLTWGFCTTKTTGQTTKLYLHVFDWPNADALELPGLRSKIQRAYLLADPNETALATKYDKDGAFVLLPSEAMDDISTTVVLEFSSPPTIEAVPIRQAFDGSVSLPSRDAVLHGATLRYEAASTHDNIGYWMNPEDWAEWEFTVSKPGRFTISATIGSLEHNTFDVIVDDQTVRCDSPVTGNYINFETVTLGEVEIASSGKVTLAIRPAKEDWQAMNVRAIRLEPVR